MKIIRHTARDMRQALRAIREQLGEDAVILSSRRTAEGVEVTAAVDFDATNLQGESLSSGPKGTRPSTEVPASAPARNIEPPDTSFPLEVDTPALAALSRPARVGVPAARVPATPPAPSPQTTTTATDAMGNELKT